MLDLATISVRFDDFVRALSEKAEIGFCPFWDLASIQAHASNGRFRGHSGHWPALVLKGSVVNDRAARLAAIPAGESPANRGVQSLL